MGTYAVEWADDSPTSWRRVSRHASRLLIPGFVDGHIHGAYGMDFMSASPDDLLVLTDKLQAEGYEAWMPTTVTADVEAVRRAIELLPNDPRILGFHLEGPFISPEYPGAQPPAAIEPIPQTESPWDEIFNHPRLKTITLAPELPGALPLTARLSQRGVAVQMGHTAATFDEARFGFEFGASGITHFFNAMRPFHHREGGMVGYGLLNRDLTLEVIADGQHINRQALSLLIAARGLERIVAVSDSTAATGLPNGTRIDLWGQPGFVGRGEVHLTDGRFAGSAVTLLDCFRTLVDWFDDETAVNLCCVNPRIRHKLGEPAVWVVLDENLRVEEVRLSAQPTSG